MSSTALKPLHFKPLNGVRIVVWSAFALVLLVMPIVARSNFALTLLCLTGIAAIACMSYNRASSQRRDPSPRSSYRGIAYARQSRSREPGRRTLPR